MNSLPGMVAKVQLLDTTYHGMAERAREYFDKLFVGLSWEYVGALIEPYSYSEAFGSPEDEPERWVGEFYAMVPIPEESSDA